MHLSIIVPYHIEDPSFIIRNHTKIFWDKRYAVNKKITTKLEYSAYVKKFFTKEFLLLLAYDSCFSHFMTVFLKKIR